MRKKALTFILIMILTVNVISSSSVVAINFSAKSYVLYCPENNKVLLEKNAHEKSLIASTTKIMTALLALETAKVKDENITITNEMLKVEGSSMGLKPGDILPLSSLVKGMLTVSGNDAANSIAFALGSSLEGFAKQMNKKAKDLGMKNTNFVTPSGLDAKGHCSTAYDLALLASNAMNNEDFLKIVFKPKIDVFFKAPKKTSVFYNENRLLRKYKGCIGGKTGYTKAAGRCLVSCAQKDNLRLIAVTLNAPDDWNDHIKLFDYGFNNFKAIIPENEPINIPITNIKGEYVGLEIIKKPVIVVKSNETPKITTKLNLPKSLYAPIPKSKVIGTITYLVNGKEYAKCNLTPVKDYSIKSNKLKFTKKASLFIKKILDSISSFLKK